MQQSQKSIEGGKAMARKYHDYLIEQLKDHDEAVAHLNVALEESFKGVDFLQSISENRQLTTLLLGRFHKIMLDLNETRCTLLHAFYLVCRCLAKSFGATLF